jgi:hypothetical protein
MGDYIYRERRGHEGCCDQRVSGHGLGDAYGKWVGSGAPTGDTVLLLGSDAESSGTCYGI